MGVRAVMLLIAVAGGTVAACAAIAGVDFDEAHPRSEAGPPKLGPDGGVLGEGGVFVLPDGAIVSNCTPEPNSVVCADKCTTTTDNCGLPRACSTDCGEGKQCVAGKCECVSNGQWCANRCGSTQDNCKRPVSCGDCDGGTACTANTCEGCSPQPAVEACAGKTCGTAMNNCGQVVACGEAQCTNPGAICQSNGTCCTDDGQACKNKCGSLEVTNNCGQKLGCPADCPSGLVCVDKACCTPEPLGTTCAGVACGPKTNNCGQVVQCPNTCTQPNSCGGGGVGGNACGCEPDDPCPGRCNITLNNRCGQAVACPNNCFDECPCAGGQCSAPSHTCACNAGPCQ